MSNLKLAPETPTPLEKLLLEAARTEQPSEAHKANLRARLGIGLPLSAPPPPVPPPARAALDSAKWAKGALGVAGLALLGGLWLTRPRAPGAALPVKSPTATPTAPAPSVDAAQVAPVASTPLPLAPLASSLPPSEPVVVAPPRTARVAPVAESVELSEQIRLIEAARAGVAARDAKGALTALDVYAAKFPRGSFGQEALVLRIRALDQAGDTARATALAQAFLARFPQSPHVARLKPIAERGASR